MHLSRGTNNSREKFRIQSLLWKNKDLFTLLVLIIVLFSSDKSPKNISIMIISAGNGKPRKVEQILPLGHRVAYRDSWMASCSHKQNPKKSSLCMFRCKGSIEIPESVYGTPVCCDARKMLIGDSVVCSEMTNACSPPTEPRRRI